MRKTGIRVLAACLAALWLAVSPVLPCAARAEKTVLLTFTGDCTIGSTEQTRGLPDSFDTVINREGYGYPFALFSGMFAADDWTIVNFEGVLSDSRNGENTGKTYRFRGPEAFAEILTISSIEAASLANNHVGDYGSRGLKETCRILTEHGISWFRGDHVATMEKDGIRIAFLAVDTTTAQRYLASVRDEIRRLRDTGEAQGIVVCFHGGNEYDAHHNETQEKLGASFIDLGANLVIMHHPHVVQGIRIRGSGAVFYSLGNFVFGGNSAIRTEPYRNREVTSLYSLVLQAELHFSDEGEYLGQQLVLFPAFTSGTAPRNNYQPLPVDSEDAEKIRSDVQADTDFQLPEITEENGFHVIRLPYLPAGQQ